MPVLPLPHVASVAAVRRGSKLKLTLEGTGFSVNESLVYVDGRPLDRTKFPRRSRDGQGGASKAVATGRGLASTIPAGGSVRVTVVNPTTGQRSSGRAAVVN